MSIGLAILITSLLAFISGSYALSVVFDGHWAAWPTAFVYALAILNLDRMLVIATGRPQSGPPEARLFKRLTPVAFRIVLAFIVGLVISVPLEHRVFAADIDAYMETEEDNRAEALRRNLGGPVPPQLARVTEDLSRLAKRQDQEELALGSKLEALGAQSDRNQYFVIQRNERGQRETVRKERPNPKFVILEQEVKRLRASIAELATSQHEGRKQLAAMTAIRDAAVAKSVQGVRASAQTLRKSFVSRHRAFEKLRTQDGASRQIAVGIRSLIILIELLPVFLKLLITDGNSADEPAYAP